MTSLRSKVNGVGLGYRREMEVSSNQLADAVNFIEIAPENWMRFAGQYKSQLHELSAAIPIVTHGLSLSIGSPDPLDVEFVKDIKTFLREYNIQYYTEHLSFCSAQGHMYDLMPIPFTEEAVRYVSQRIKQVQDILEQPIALENVSYYLSPSNELSELEFTQAVLSESNCQLLLDVNNVYVNSINHQYDAKTFIDAMPSERIAYGHIAGHWDYAEDLKIDTHGDDVIDPVWQLLNYAYEQHGLFPTLLERDFDIPPFEILLKEVNTIKQIQAQQVLTKHGR